MPQPYSADLRERVLVAYEHGEGTQVAIAHRFRVSPATVCNWVRQARQNGRRRPKPHRGGPAGRLGPAELALLQGLLRRHALRAHCASQRSHEGYEGTDLSYRVLLRDSNRLEDLLNELRNVEKVSRVTSLKAEEESEL